MKHEIVDDVEWEIVAGKYILIDDINEMLTFNLIVNGKNTNANISFDRYLSVVNGNFEEVK